MLCDICRKNIATVHLTEIVNDKVVEMHICQKCAKEKAEELKEQLSIAELLGGLVDVGSKAKHPAEVSLKCPSCGLTYREFKKGGRLGCENCYDTFSKQLFPLLKKVHGAMTHSGKTPSSLREKAASPSRIEHLQQRLKLAIEREEYEEAARLRDQIKKLEQ